MPVRSAIIFDGYVDEPTALGVPPYISPYPRYAAGVLSRRGVPWRYVTVDSWRDDPAVRDAVASLDARDLLVVVAGLTVPGHYKGGTPLSLSELQAVARASRCPVLIGGPIRHGYTLTGGTAAMPLPRIEKAALATRDLDAALDRFLTDPEDESGQARMHTFADVAKTAPAGADVVRQHPGFPHVMAEIETARGCERTVHCTFCTEGLYPTCEYRPHDDIVAEVAALYAAGARHFRLGKQPNLLAWPGRRDGTGQVVPSPRDIEALYRDIRAAAPDLKTLHIDNVNPGFIASFPGPCSQIASIIAAANTPGDVAALGLESADPAVVAANHLKATAEDTLTAVRVLNAAGAHRDGRHLPALLPGLNLLLGLPGESARTYELDLDLLRRILDEGLLVRRINVRQVMAFPETPLHRLFAGKPPRIDKVRFHRFKQKVQEEIEQPMLQRVAPVGTLLPGVVTEFYDGDVTFGRQLASYPLLVGFPLKLPLRTVVTAMIVGHGFRSVTALPHPIDINGLPARALQALPGVGRPRARRLAEARPFATPAEAAAALDDPRVLAPFLDDIRTLVFPAPPT